MALLRNNLQIYSDFASEWWEPRSPHFKSLQNLTPFRLELISEMIGKVAGKTLLDLGCGGGLIAIPLLGQGATVIGVDISAASIAEARRAAAGAGEFLVGDIRSLPFSDESADIVLLVDVLDHVRPYHAALAEASRVLKPGGIVFAGTINRTWVSRLLAIFLAERLGYVPRGTHRYDLFIRPQELIQSAADCNLIFRSVQGEWPEILNTIRRGAICLKRSSSLMVAYCMSFEKRV